MRLDFNLAKPIYMQIVDEYRRAIARGQLAPGDKIQSQRELALQARVNPNTVQRAYREMEQMGLTETLRGQGTFIRHDSELLAGIRQEMATEALETFVGEMRALAFTDEQLLHMVRRHLQTDAHPGDGKEDAPNGKDD